MPFKSEAQKKKMAHLVAQGKMKQSTYDEMMAETGDEKLPDRVTPKKSKKEVDPNKLKSLEDVRLYRKQKYGV